LTSFQAENQRLDNERRAKAKADAEEKIRQEDEEEVKRIQKFKAYGKKEQSVTIPKEEEKEKTPKEKEKKKKKKVKSDGNSTSTPQDDELTVESSITNENQGASRPTTASEVAVAEQLKRLEEIEKSMKEKEQRMLEAAKLAEEKAAAMERALEMMEKRAKEEEFERSQRRKFLEMAAGPLSGSPYSSIGPLSSSRPPPASSRSAMGTGRNAMGSSRAPPTARSARDGTPRPKEMLKITVSGVEWIQLWDPAESTWYWYCEASGAAQWEQPIEPPVDQSGYESTGALTDYSTDNYESGGESYGGETLGPWQEFWDESAQAKYWYNNETGEATWTMPEEFAASSNNSVDNSGAGEWVSYIDDTTGQEYWYNPTTGETSWG
jgi:hypothetical protein